MRTPMEYLEALEYQYDEDYQPILPTKFRCRFRVGRSGRLVVDRIPVHTIIDDDINNFIKFVLLVFF